MAEEMAAFRTVCDTTAVRSLQITTRHVFEGMSGAVRKHEVPLVDSAKQRWWWGLAGIEVYFVSIIRGVTKQKYR